MATRTPRGSGQYDGVARALERIGERWALLIVRDLLAGARRYGDLKAGLPRIPTNILSDRLRELQEAGVVRRVPAVRAGYELTELGRRLEPVVLALERWGWTLLGAVRDGEVLTADAVATALRSALRPAAGDEPPIEFLLRVGEVEVSALVDRGALDVAAVGAGAVPGSRRDEPASPPTVVRLVVGPERFAALLRGDPIDDGDDGDDAESVRRFRARFRMPDDRGAGAPG